MLELLNIYKNYTQESNILQNINFEIKKESCVQIFGISGSGITSLFKILTLNEKASKGSIILNGKNVNRKSRSEKLKFIRETGIISEDTVILEDLTVIENIEIPLRIKGESSKISQAKVSEILKILKLEHKKNSKGYELSRSEKRLVYIGRCIIKNPKILIADNIFSQIDSNQKEIIEKLINILVEIKTTIILLTNEKLVENHSFLNFDIKDLTSD